MTISFTITTVLKIAVKIVTVTMVNIFNKIVRVMIMSDMSNHNRDDVNDMKVHK